jgi:hypothetical protein
MLLGAKYRIKKMATNIAIVLTLLAAYFGKATQGFESLLRCEFDHFMVD